MIDYETFPILYYYKLCVTFTLKNKSNIPVNNRIIIIACNLWRNFPYST